MKARREGALKGGYIAKKESAPLDLILLSAGSELQHALKAAEQLGPGTRVVSMPSFSRFDKQPEAYREHIMPRHISVRTFVEASASEGLLRWVGLSGKAVGLNRYGLSAPAAQVFAALGITTEAVVTATLTQLEASQQTR